MYSRGHWQVLVEDKHRRQLAAIPAEWILKSPPSKDVLDVRAFPESDQCGLLSPREIEITNTTDVAVLLDKLATAKWSAVEVTVAFYKRAIIAHQLVNCLTEIFVERAVQRAQELDEYLKQNGKPFGPLHGLPISLKDQICIKGLEATMGYASYIGKYSKNDAVMTQILYSCGAVPFVMTNVPQTLMWAETFNLVYGRTLNPANRSLTSGGSSGGEGALIGMKGSPLGVGSDIGGSVRYPSAFNGLYGLRPSYSRVPYSGCVNSLEGQDSVPSSLGPISNSLSGIKVFFKAVLGAEPWLLDPLCIRKKWDEDAYNLVDHGRGEKLCFAMMWDDGEVIPHPPVQRAMDLTQAALREQGHSVIAWRPENHREIYDTVEKIWMSGALEDIKAVLETTGEPRVTSMAPENTTGTSTGLNYTESVSAYKLWQFQKARIALREQYLKAWRETANITGTGRPIDAIIAPVAPCAAPPHGKTIIAAYTVVWSALNYTCCAFPVTSVIPELDPVAPRSVYFSDIDKENWPLCEYDPETFKNAPIGLQLIGQPLEEEAVLAMTEIVDRALKSAKQNQKL